MTRILVPKEVLQAAVNSMRFCLVEIQLSEGNDPHYSQEDYDLLDSHNTLKALLDAPCELVAYQHKEPIVNNIGETIGYTQWTDGRALLKSWPERPLYAPKEST